MTHRYFCSLIVVLLVTAVGRLSAIGMNDPEFLAVKQVQEKHTDALLSLKGVVGTAVGLDAQNRLAVHVYVTDASVKQIPTIIDGKPVYIVVTGPFHAQRTKEIKKQKGNETIRIGAKPGPVDRMARFDRPVPIGISTGHPDVSAGTIACRVTDGENVYALSNNHVYANYNDGLIGDPVLQPGPFDGGTVLNDVVGQLFNFVPLVFSDIASNTIDAAIALSTPELIGDATPSDGYGRPRKTTAQPGLLMPVKKYGRTTGLTKGQITGLNATVSIIYSGQGLTRFVNQIMIMPGNFGGPGDSGALVVKDASGKYRSEDRKPIGMIIGGSSTTVVANPIDPVLQAFDVTIDGE